MTRTGAADWNELESIVTQLRHLPRGSRSDGHAMEERYREQKIAGQRLAQLLDSSPSVRAAFDRALEQVNGVPGDAKSFDLLDKLLDEQWYRLANWRVASDEINYRRFFDVNDLAAIRVEDPRVFDAVHRLVGRLLESGAVTGLRIDHPDGLRDPQNYFKSLQALYRSTQSISGGAVQMCTSSPRKFSLETSRWQRTGPFAARPDTIFDRKEVPHTILGTSNREILTAVAQSIIEHSYERSYIAI